MDHPKPDAHGPPIANVYGPPMADVYGPPIEQCPWTTHSQCPWTTHTLDEGPAEGTTKHQGVFRRESIPDHSQYRVNNLSEQWLDKYP